MRGPNGLMDGLLAKSFRHADASHLDKAIKSRLRSSHWRRSKPAEGRGLVYNGQYYRFPRQNKRDMPLMPQIPLTFASPFCSFKPVYPRRVARRASSAVTKFNSFFNKEDTFDDVLWKLREWWKRNWSTVIMNLGSICTLIGFTRSDVLELRAFSMTGSISAVIYNLSQRPVRYPTVAWSSTFAFVNFIKICQILDERKSAVHLNEEQEEIYSKFFMPHGVTPKQFEAILSKANVEYMEKGDCLVQKGQRFDHVYLVVEGGTRANISGRYLTAISFSPQHHETKAGGASGAWVGEIAFLEYYGRLEQAKVQNPKNAPTPRAEQHPDNQIISEQKGATPVGEHETTATPAAPNDSTALNYAFYSVVAKEDSKVIMWTYKDMESLMSRSTDMRSAMTRAMTAALVGKVVNFTISRSKGLPTWSTWLDDWKYSAGAKVQVVANQDTPMDDHKDEGTIKIPTKTLLKTKNEA